MDRNFNKSLDLVLKSEGGFVNLKADPGGATNLGITIATYRRYIKPTGTIDDLKKLTKEQAGVCYRRQYWDAVAGADLPDGVDYAVFDFGVNSGVSRSAKYLQRVVGVPQDGRIGPATVKAAGAKPAGVTIDALCDARLAFLKGLKTWSIFGKGWDSRVASVRAQALKMAAQPAPIVIQPTKADTPVVVTQKGAEPPVVSTAPVPPSAQPTIPKGKTGIVAFVAIVISIIAGFLKLHFGG